jgi:bacillithiol synthase
MPEERLACSRKDMLAFLDATPERFSPNVALRCLTQQAIFPSVAAYVAGPGEVAYWAEFKGLFEDFGQPMPVVWPRARAVISTLKHDQLLERYGLEPPDLMRQERELIDAALQRIASGPGLECLAEKRPEIENALAGLKADLEGLDLKNPDLLKLVDSITGHTTRGLERLERQLARQESDQAGTAARHIRRLCTALAPDRSSQERVYSVCSFLFEQGSGLIPRLLENLDIEKSDLNRITL